CRRRTHTRSVVRQSVPMHRLFKHHRGRFGLARGLSQARRWKSSAMTRTRYVGQAVERLEDLRLLTGRGQFVDDLHCEGLLHAAIYRSNVAHGRIVSIDATAARAMTGVHAV